MQIRLTDKLTQTSKHNTNTLVKFEERKVFKERYSECLLCLCIKLSKILAKLHICDHFLQIFLINVINLLAKTMSYKEIKNKHILKIVHPIAFKQKLKIDRCI